MALPSLLAIFGVHGFSGADQLATAGRIAPATGALAWGPLFSTPPMFDSNVACFAASVAGAPAFLIPTGAPEGGGRVFFAGEATSTTHPQTVHGAYSSGLTAADAIVKGTPPSTSNTLCKATALVAAFAALVLL